MALQQSENDTPYYTGQAKARIDELIDQLHESVSLVEDCGARSLFQTTAEVLIGLSKAFEDYEKKNEEIWKEQARPIK